MTYKELKQKIKEEQKSLAQKIKVQKGKRKKVASGYVYGLETIRLKYRYNHISYCMLFNNTPYELIEQPRDDNTPNFDHINNIKHNWEIQIDEALSDCA